MANIKLSWVTHTVAAEKLTDWRSFVSDASPEIIRALQSRNAVYVIRTARPFSFAYEKAHSPVIYIGKGQAKTRLTSHLRTWLLALTEKIPSMKIEVSVCSPRAPWHGQVCEEVEADLIYLFEQQFGTVPVRNRRREYAKYPHTYERAGLAVLRPGRGRGYVWGLTPLRSSPLYG